MTDVVFDLNELIGAAVLEAVLADGRAPELAAREFGAAVVARLGGAASGAPSRGGRPVSPCANCGSVHGEMVHAHGKWIHRRPADCIVHLRARLRAVENQPGDVAATPPAPAVGEEATP